VWTATAEIPANEEVAFKYIRLRNGTVTEWGNDASGGPQHNNTLMISASEGGWQLSLTPSGQSRSQLAGPGRAWGWGFV